MTRLQRLLQEGQRRKAISDPLSCIPHKPHPKQVEFLGLEELEVLYGGAAGGGKSDAILMAGAKHAYEPKYSALMLRRTFKDLNLPGAIMDRSKSFYGGFARWHSQDYRWTFPSGAVIQFGYCDSEGDLGRYKGGEYQFIAIDEVTEWPEPWVTFLFSRLRRTADMKVPLQMRYGTNPDGIGQEWVRRRFAIPLGETPTAPIRVPSEDRVFLPARAEDNPSLDIAAYDKSLQKLGPARYAQLRWGRWIRDGEGLVYKYDATRNRAPGLRWSKRDWTTILSHDYGTTNATAWVVLGWMPHDSTLYIIESFKEAGMSPGEAAEISHRLTEKYSPVSTIGDLGGLGKGYAEEARKRLKLPIEAADKQNKRGYIDLLNGDLQSGAIKLLDGNEELEKEWLELPWKKATAAGELKEEAPGFANHCADAALYGWRKSLAYTEEREKKRPAEGSPEWMREEEERLVREHDEEASRPHWERATGNEWWQR